MKPLKILIVMLILIMTVGAVCAEDPLSGDALSDDNANSLETPQNEAPSAVGSKNTFTDFQSNLNQTEDSLEVNDDYKFNNESDSKSGILIAKNNFIINGNNHILDGNNQSRIFNITGENITILNLVLVNGNAKNGGAIYVTGKITLNNVTFINNNATGYGGAICANNAVINCNNSRFIDNICNGGSAIYAENRTEIKAYNTYMTSKITNKYAHIVARKSNIILDNLSFVNTIAKYCPAVYADESNSTIVNSRFENLTANISAGAIAIKGKGNTYIKNCEFINTSSTKNAGAINADVYGDVVSNVTISDTLFKDTSSSFGGAYIQLGGQLFLYNSTFTNNSAAFNGGAVYISYVTSEICNCTFNLTGVETFEGYPTCGGAIYCDCSQLFISNSTFANTTAYFGDAIYAHDSNYHIKNTSFFNNENDIFTNYDGNLTVLEDNIYSNNDSLSLNNTIYATYIDGEGMELTLLNNTIDVTTLPSKFDLRDWGWVSPVRNQGWMGSCWAFGMTGALESALLKACGITTDFSENNMQNTMLQYSIYGQEGTYEGADNLASSGYLLSWLGAFSQDADTYDEVGKISPAIATGNDVHIQDVIFIPNNEIPNGTQLKLALLKYGSLDVSYYGQSKFDEKNPLFNNKTNAQYCNNTTLVANHEVSLVGWDDNYPKENFVIQPPGNGAWIIKNSWDTTWGDKGYLYLSYYDTTFIKSDIYSNYATAIIIENTMRYNKNYQYDFFWGGIFFNSTVLGVENITCANQFEAFDDDLIAAVGTYFKEEGYNYTVQIYVNGVLVLTQDGVSPYCGYHTIKLDKYIPIKNGDVFGAAITSKFMPVTPAESSRSQICEDISFIYNEGIWEDFYQETGAIFNIKAYTVADDSKIINNNDISVDYAGGKYFSVKVVTADGHAVGAGASVKFTINGKTTTVKTDKNGIAKIKINDVPGKYTIKTRYNGKTYSNKVTVKQVLTTSKMTVKKTAKSFTMQAKLKINGKLVKGKTVKFKLNGKTYTAKTNSKGIAKVTVKKNDILKLKKGKTYTVKVTYLKDTIKTTVKVK
ncbi:MAG: hypothetical protein IJF83_08795 [Methanobrevibacter sp.]|nr:hypothetical protein [Methanobrevibacter sp.]